MNAEIVFSYVSAFLFAVLSAKCDATKSNLYKLAVQQGLSIDESLLLIDRKNEAPRYKRQQGTQTTKLDLLQNQAPECGINGKSVDSMKSNNKAKQMDWPWIASLLNSQYLGHFCGGALLNRNYILTAAHCVQGRVPKDITVRLGELDFLTMNETESKDYAIEEIKLHSDYDAATQRHDIALLKLKTLVTYNNYIRPICLPSSPVKVNQTAFVAGWGIIFYGGPFSDVLLEVSVPIWDLDNCISSYTQPVFKTNICAAGYEGNRDSCAGDSGGPLVVQEKNGRWVNVGVVSWGIGCGNVNEPGVYTNVGSYLSWLQSKMPDAVI